MPKWLHAVSRAPEKQHKLMPLPGFLAGHVGAVDNLCQSEATQNGVVVGGIENEDGIGGYACDTGLSLRGRTSSCRRRRCLWLVLREHMSGNLVHGRSVAYKGGKK